MGNWRNRPNRRYFYRQIEPKSPPSYSYDNDPSSSGFCEDGIPLWEKKFCTLIGSVPWQKVVDTQKFMYSNNVLNWDDSAGKEAFQNAKERFWAQINGFPCDICFPDPDIYIDKIDWNPDIDPEMIKDLESVYFAPDEGEKNGKVRRRNKKLRYLASVNVNSGSINPWEGNNNMQDGGVLKDKAQNRNKWDNGDKDLNNTNINDNPWESCFTQGNDVVKDKVQGWKQWDDNNQNNDAKKINNDENPWEHSFSQGNGAVTKNTWGNCGEGWNQGSVKDNRGWGDSGNNSWGWSQQKSWKLDAGDSLWKRNFTEYTRHPEDIRWRDSRGSARDTGWRDNWDNAQDRGCRDNNAQDKGWRDNNARDKGWRNNGGDAWGGSNRNNEPKHLEFGRRDGNWRAWNGNCRKREGSQLTSYRSSEHQPDYNKFGQCWRSRNSNKRVQFGTFE